MLFRMLRLNGFSKLKYAQRGKHGGSSNYWLG
jgi:hypothetical protein